jgi:transcriptional regulator with XRE-family HTH domain
MRSIDILRRARKTRGRSVREVAEALGVNPRTVYRFEAGGGIRSALLFKIPIAYEMSRWMACVWFWRAVQEERYRLESLEEVNHERT